MQQQQQQQQQQQPQQPQQYMASAPYPAMMPMTSPQTFRRINARHAIFKVGVGGIFLSALLFIVGYLAPAWIDRSGLWMSCDSSYVSNVGNSRCAWFDAVRAMETFALVCFLLCVGVELYQDVFKSPPPADNRAVEILAGLAALFGLIGIIIFGVKVERRVEVYGSPWYDGPSYNYYSYHMFIEWGYALAAAGSILVLLCSGLVAYSRVKHAAQTKLALEAAGVHGPTQPAAASAPFTMPMQPMMPGQPMQMPPNASPGAPAGYYPYMPAHPYPSQYPYPYPPPAVTPLTAPPVALAPEAASASTPSVVTGAATQGLPTSQVPAFYVFSQGQLVPVYREMPTTTAASPLTTATTTEQTVVSNTPEGDGQPSNRL